MTVIHKISITGVPGGFDLALKYSILPIDGRFGDTTYNESTLAILAETLNTH